MPSTLLRVDDPRRWRFAVGVPKYNTARLLHPRVARKLIVWLHLRRRARALGHNPQRNYDEHTSQRISFHSSTDLSAAQVPSRP